MTRKLPHLLFWQSKYDEADALQEQALEINRKILGPDHPDVATVLNNRAGRFVILVMRIKGVS